MKASAWIETNRSACTRRDLRTRSASGTKKSASRVRKARMSRCALMRSRSASATESTTSFSFRPVRADRARVLAAMAGVDRHDHQAFDLAYRVGRWRPAHRGLASGRFGGRRRRGGGSGLAVLDLADEFAQRVAHRAGGGTFGAFLLADQLEQRVASLARVAPTMHAARRRCWQDRCAGLGDATPTPAARPI